MSDLLAEVDEAMRRERLEKFWHENKSAIIVFIATLILGTAAISAYKTWTRHIRIQNTNALYTALDNETFPNNITPGADLNVEDDLKALALLNAASSYLEQEQIPEALALYEQVAQDKTITKDMRDLATLLQVRLRTQQENENPEDLIALLKPITTDPGSTSYAHALLESAVLEARTQNYAKALENLEILKEIPDLPETIYVKTQSLSHVYSLKDTETKAKTSEQKS